ncbi:MAG: hypothetical protein MJZ81_09605 [Bacteroidales bacterium]|nr:hypothetical protein [Bacteroidales bacterium]
MGKKKKEKESESKPRDRLLDRAVKTMDELYDASPERAAEMANDVCNLIRDLIHERRNGYGGYSSY